MSIRRHARLLVLVGSIMILLVRVQAQLRPQDEHPGEDQQFFMQMDEAHAHAFARWTNTLDITLNYNLSNGHASPPDNGMYHVVRFYHSTPPQNWIKFPNSPTPDEWQSTPFHLDDVTQPGWYVVTGDFKWSQGVDHYKCHVYFDPTKPKFITDKNIIYEFVAGLGTGTTSVVFKFTDNMADWCLVNGAVRRADTNEVVGQFSKDSAGKLMRCGVINSANLVPLIGKRFAVGKYYVIIYIWDLAGNMATSDKKYFPINPVKPIKR